MPVTQLRIQMDDHANSLQSSSPAGRTPFRNERERFMAEICAKMAVGLFQGQNEETKIGELHVLNLQKRNVLVPKGHND